MVSSTWSADDPPDYEVDVCKAVDGDGRVYEVVEDDCTAESYLVY